MRDCRPMKLTSRYSSKSFKGIITLALGFALAPSSWTQVKQEQSQDSGTSTDLFVMVGSDFVRPGLATKANYNIGIGHTFGFLKKDPIGDEVTFGYTYEDAGSGFWALTVRFPHGKSRNHEELRTPEDEARDGI